jgi:hypothetical protein
MTKQGNYFLKDLFGFDVQSPATALNWCLICAFQNPTPHLELGIARLVVASGPDGDSEMSRKVLIQFRFLIQWPIWHTCP